MYNVKKNFIILLSALLLIIPIVYISLCISYNFNPLTSFVYLEQLYNDLFVQKKVLTSKAYISISFGFLPLLGAIMYIKSNIQKTNYGYAKFATKSEIKKMEGVNFKKGVLLGAFKGSKLFFNDNRSMLLLAPARTGKTSGYILTNLLSLEKSSIVIDIKKELALKTAKYRKEVLKNDVYFFEPYGEENNFFFNPFTNELLKKISFAKKLELVKEIANILFIDENTRDPHWVESAKRIFIFIAIYDIEENEESNLYELMRYFKKGEDELLTPEYLNLKNHLEEELETKIEPLKMFFRQVYENENLNEITKDLARGLENIPNGEFQSIMSTFDRKMAVFADPRIKKIVSKNSFNFDDLRKKKITLYLIVKNKDINTLSPLYAIYIMMLINSLTVQEPKNKDEKVYLYLDEFIRLGKLPQLIEAPSFVASFQLILLYIAQTPSQIERVYGKQLLDELIANTAYKVILTMPSFSEAKPISETIGNTTRNRTSETTQPLKILGNKNLQEEGYKLLTEQDLINLKKGESVISVLGYQSTPIKGSVCFAHKIRKFKKILKKYGD